MVSSTMSGITFSLSRHSSAPQAIIYTAEKSQTSAIRLLFGWLGFDTLGKKIGRLVLLCITIVKIQSKSQSLPFIAKRKS